MASSQSQGKENIVKGGAQNQNHQDASPITTSLIRQCAWYQDEYNECLSSKGRRHQIFVYGNVLDCEPWAQDFKNCQKWTWTADEEAARAIIENERSRLEERLKPHLSTNVWTKREQPPADWNKPLPEFEKMTKNSYLTLVSEKGEDAASLSTACILQ